LDEIKNAELALGARVQVVTDSIIGGQSTAGDDMAFIIEDD